MLLHVTHVHTAESCPGADPERMEMIGRGFAAMEDVARASDVRVIAGGYAFAQHSAFFLIDAPTALAAQTFFEGIFPGVPATVHMTPVMDLAEAKQTIAARVAAGAQRLAAARWM